MRQVGVLAAAGLVAIETMIPRLAEDHAHAALLARALEDLPGVRVAPVATNIVVATLAGARAPQVVEALAARGVLASAMDAFTLRLVTHRDVGGTDCHRAGALAAEMLG